MALTLAPQIIQTWQVFLSPWFVQKNDLMTLLNEQELQRAHRFKFDIHRDRFIVARAFLRKILSLYTDIPPEKIEFNYGKRGKPWLAENPLDLQFNISHSDDVAVYGISQTAEIGIDVEKFSDKYEEAVAKRFFSPQEYLELSELVPEQRARAFYQIWVKKEAIIKALGEGLYAPLADFSIHWNQQNEKILMAPFEIYVQSIDISAAFSAAVAVTGPIKEILRWEWKIDNSSANTVA